MPRLTLLCRVGIGLAACALPQAAGAAPRDAFPLIAQAMRAKLTHAYVGRQDILFVSGSGGASQQTQIVADIARDRKRARMTYRLPLSLAGLATVDDGVRLCQFGPTHRLTHTFRSTTAEEAGGTTQRMLALLHRNYRCVRLRREAVSGRLCDVVALHPRFYPSPTRLCWIDSASRLILRTEEYDDSGRRLYVASYETIRLVPRLPAQTFRLPSPSRAAEPLPASPMQPTDGWARAFRLAGVSGRLPAWSPRGYQLLGCAVLTKTHGEKAAVLRYGDGLKTLSVFEEALALSRPGAARQQEMLCHHLARSGQQAWVRDRDGLRVTLLGDVTLPAAVAAEVLSALGTGPEAALRRGVTRDFGEQAARRAARLRRQGWGYDQIVALDLSRRTQVRPTSERTETLARRWVAQTVSHAP